MEKPSMPLGLKSSTVQRVLWTGILAMAGIFLQAPLASADEPDPAAQFDTDGLPEPKARTKVLLVGTGVTLGFYGAAVGASYLWQNDYGASDLRIPVVGPWMKIGRTRLCEEDAENCYNVLKVIGAVLAGLDGLGQLGGVAILTQGILMKTAPKGSSGSWHSTTETAFSPLSGYHSREFSVRALPLSGGGMDVGLGLVGEF
ncbi:MAG: hypothetical protein MK135_12890 [Polyangiaceae bacterium]|nr:hypothetical protein [Polyangiaceae bacterium]